MVLEVLTFVLVTVKVRYLDMVTEKFMNNIFYCH